MEYTICKAVEAALKTRGLHYTHEDDTFELFMSDDKANFKIRVIADDERDILLIIGFFPVKVSKENLDKMYKVINDINYQTIFGGFVIDSEDGELTFRLVNNADDGAINEKVATICIYQVAHCLSSHYEEIMQAMYGGDKYTFTFDRVDNRPRA